MGEKTDPGSGKLFCAKRYRDSFDFLCKRISVSPGDFCICRNESGHCFDIGNPWGSGGCAFVWDWLLRNPVRLAQNFSFSKSGIDKRISRGYNRPTS